MVAKGMAAAAGKPFLAVNHLEGHALSARLTSDVAFPFLLLLISGGHCQILQVDGLAKYTLYGQTVDDAIGESFDKVARMLGLGYPGGPLVEEEALKGDQSRFNFPKPTVGNFESCDFSLSGLKTAVKRTVDTLGSLSEKDVADVCASFQYTVAQIIAIRLEIAIKRFKAQTGSNKLVVAGGVAANKFLFERMKVVADGHGFVLITPPIALCTDNAAMIAWVGVEKMRLGMQDELSFAPRSRWPLY
jgi:N6-L-threonylcarbamoyladenine synthase